jgi:hypothetical protein
MNYESAMVRGSPAPDPAYKPTRAPGRYELEPASGSKLRVRTLPHRARSTSSTAAHAGVLLLAALLGRRAFLDAAQRLGCLKHALSELPLGVEQLLGKVVEIGHHLLWLGHVGRLD